MKATKTEASAKLLPMHPALRSALLEWKSQSRYSQPEDFVFPSPRFKGRKPLDLGAVLKRKIKPAFAKLRIVGVGWHTFRHTVGTMLAEMGEHQLTIRDYLRHSTLHVTNKYLQATAETKREAQVKLVNAILPAGFVVGRSTLILNSDSRRRRSSVLGRVLWGWAYRTQMDPDLFSPFFGSA